LAEGSVVGFGVRLQTPTYRQQYLQLLGAASTKDFEDQVVGAVTQALCGHPRSGLQVRLSKVARDFNIRPLPEFIPGAHDGEITFQQPPGEFVIKLCNADGNSLRARAAEPRMRFTYAHEFAHRFFFVHVGDKWERALHVVTSNLDTAERMRHRITLRRIEEGLCNRIARRLLIPDEFLDVNWPADWLSEGEKFFDLLSVVAGSLGVSRDCLLVRLQDIAPEGASHCAFVVGYSKGPVTQRGASKPRIVSGIFPSCLGSGKSRQFYPGAEWASFGECALNFFVERIQAGKPLLSDITLEVGGGVPKGMWVLRGWARIMSPNSMLIWGHLM
jgi:hypothetical protein